MIHRDLKPANIKIREDGTVKVLDFGLAKAMAGDVPDQDLSQSPTMTATMGGTREGVILGTAAYMSPEQARGKPVDKRTDIWSFGCVLFEMLTGRAAFAGETLSDTIGRVMEREPAWDALPVAVPAAVRKVLRRCLVKSAGRRLRDIGDAGMELDEVGSTPDVEPEHQVAAGGVVRLWQRPVAGVSIAVLAAAGAALAVWISVQEEPPPPVRFAVASGEVIAVGGQPNLALSPDGDRLAYLAVPVPFAAGEIRVRRLDQFTSETLVAEGEVSQPFFSPDGTSLGFQDRSAGRILKRVDVRSGLTSTICDLAGGLMGASWGDDGFIVFATDASSGLLRVAAAGGDPEQLTTPDRAQGEVDHVWPQILPDGSAVLFTILSSSIAESRIAVLSLDTEELKIVHRGGTYPVYSPTGHLLFGVEDDVLAVGFDLSRLATVGEPTVVQEDVLDFGRGPHNFGLSRNGTLAYLPGRATERTAPLTTLVWVDREGREESVAGARPRPYAGVQVSPDGTRLALDVRDENIDIWVHDLDRGTQSRLTLDPGPDRFPVWTPDSTRVAFASRREGRSTGAAYWKPVATAGGAELLVGDPDIPLTPFSWTPDGQTLLLVEASAADIGVVTLDGERARRTLLGETFTETAPALSPDGLWLAYGSNESGLLEIYLRPFPDVLTTQVKVTTEGGRFPEWSPDGRELFFQTLEADKIMGVTVETVPDLRLSQPRVVIEGNYRLGGSSGRAWDVHPDGQRFVLRKPADPSDADATSEQINVVLNWTQELLERVPIN